jgi:endonuclease/exonuclease/phosphatase family metal-dependent hydrolase
MLLFPLLLQRRFNLRGWQAASGLTLALSLSILFRTANSGSDLSQSGMFQVIGWLLGILAIALLWRADLSGAGDRPSGQSPSNGRLTGLTIGLASVILMIYFAFASPTVIARWTGASYPVIVGTLVLALTVFGILLGSERFTAWLTRRLILGWNLLFVIALVLTILSHQVPFPATRDVYPIESRAVSPLAGIFLFAMLILSPVIFIDFMLFVREISADGHSLRQLGGSFALAALFLLVMVFFHVFTTIYDYASIVGPFFRDRFWFVYLLVGLGLGLPLLLLRKGSFTLGQPQQGGPFVPITLGALALLSVIALYLTMARPVPPQSETQWKIMTYNLQQGYDKQGNKGLETQLAVIREVDPDLLGLQESDTARVANGNVDMVRYFADRLDMYSYYGPTTTTGTFGIALLSKYPIRNPTTFFMVSTGEQTATIQAKISREDKTYQIFVTHLGNRGPIFQLEDILGRIQGTDADQPIIAMGDFNFQSDTDQYALMTRTLADSWLLRWPDGKATPRFPGDKRIDYIFVSAGLDPLEAEYVVSPASDHPYMYIVLEP